MSRQHLLRQLALPDRYERLVSLLGPEVVQVLVPPEQNTVDGFERIALAVQTRNEGLLVPAFGQSGIGKTTMLDNLTHFLPEHYSQTLNYQGDISFDSLEREANAYTQGYPPSETRVLPINVDHRENAPPTDRELADMKRFLRVTTCPVRPVIIWPDTSESNTRDIAARYTQVAGVSPVDLPLTIAGPQREAWIDIARNTLRLANEVDSLEQLGVDPSNYDPADYQAIGAFLRQLSTDFDNIRFQLQKETRKQISLVVIFPSESETPGILSQLTNSTRYGLIDPSALLGVTAKSSLGRWWEPRRGLLTRAVVQLDAHCLFLPPGISVGFLRRHGPQPVQDALGKAGIPNPTADRLARDLARADFGKFLTGGEMKAYEARGKPAKKSVEAFQTIAAQGFVQGKDKALNKGVAEALRTCLPKLSVNPSDIQVEKQLDFCRLIPDISLHYPDNVLCAEFHWRNGNFLSTSNRSATAQYILKKLRDYCRQLGWTAD